MEGNMMEMFEVGPCEDDFHLGFLIGQRFRDQIRSRLAGDLILQNQLLPFARTTQAQPLIKALSETNQNKFPRYWDELLGTAEGSGVPILQIILVNLRKEILPFISKAAMNSNADTADDCSDILIVGDSMAIAAHNEDANVALVGHTYLIKGKLSNGLSFVAYTYAGELPSCAFGFNSQGLAFTLNSVPPAEAEIVPAGIGRNFVSRDLLEATSITDALDRRMILNVETASRSRVSVHEVGTTPFFHANMYLHLQVQQIRLLCSRVIPTTLSSPTLALVPSYQNFLVSPFQGKSTSPPP
ncbi:hypothetical protein F3Y22_tig00111942pilonHSYRG00103 [Hibiscus syriacus]|uniref:Peptidase C45 hydrolase domain-containing protein n=1 Tax=Hibiscus syriacus TaxID=106335 RepID=A0A6A2XP02_HIBSY|nr:hypothetical protein F3Y22_tig00111942pilonHSYRG00103 [Hibiscus syriacus]